STAAPSLRVVVVDDSASTRRWIRTVLERAGISVVAEAGDGRSGRDQILAHDPDVVVLDLVMPDVDGLTLLRAITQHAPRPVVVLSGQTEPGGPGEMNALQAGATHVLCKPRASEADALALELVRRVRQAARASVRYDLGQVHEVAGQEVRFAPRQLIAIGASTGGPGALRAVLAGMPRHTPPIVIAQHTPPSSSSNLAARLGAVTGHDVRDAQAGETLAAGAIRVAPPDRHLLVEWTPAGYVTRLGNGAAEHFQRPAVDVLFRSVAVAAKHLAIGVLLTGMGEDGASGLAAMRAAGAQTIAQDEATSVVYGMPRAAIELGAASTIAGLDRIATSIVRGLRRLEAA
ncbi:MAG: chemotaxis-specific protein-glutamate methyltransferase CheB, partial [Deltaproteobacteria bacterium]|nr:chemotaxis-specific protein-glutamate methyltransferase CheB [Deltaproteobacteria bacterium]